MRFTRCAVLAAFWACCLVTAATVTQCKTIYVKPNGLNTNSGLSWTLAKKTIYSGLGAALPGDEVWVAAGVYEEDQIKINPDVALYGGFAGTEASRSQRNFRTNLTVLNARFRGVAITVASGADAATRIDGFTIKNGFNWYKDGAGIVCVDCSPTIANNTIAYCCTPDNRGGGIYCKNSSPIISGNLIMGNYARTGGAIYISGPSSPIITNNTITRNDGPEAGGIYWTSSSPQICNNLIAFNSSGLRGGTSVPCTLRNNNVYNPDGVNYDFVSPGVGDISVDPRFASISLGYFHIQPDSPCRDVGWNDAPDMPSSDTDEQPRVQPSEGVVDIGVDESDGTMWNIAPVIVRVDGANGSDANNGSTWALAKKTVQAALDSVVGGEVWVKAGTYSERVALRPYVFLYGGFAGAETTREERNWSANSTVLMGDGLGSVVTGTNLGYRNSAVDGFTVRNGGGSYGGGIYLYGNSSPIICNNRIVNNTAGVGGGISCETGCRPMIYGNVITGNNATDGGGIYASGGEPTIIGNTIVGNSAAYEGGGIKCGLRADLYNNIIAYNSSGISASSYVVLRNNLVYNPGGYNYSGCEADATDISVDPKLAGWQYGNVHIQPDSPCRDAGWNGAPGIPSLDIDNQPRVQPVGGSVDIGADESDGTVWSVAPVIVRVDGANGSDTNDGSSWTLAKKTVQAAIDGAAVAGGEVWVKAGIYNEKVKLKAYAYVYGGFAGTETERDERDWAANPTILDAKKTGSVVTAAQTGARLSTIDGFTIRGGRASEGGGILCSGASLIIAHNTICGNDASSGGGIYSDGSSSPLIVSCIITDNTSSNGGGIFASGSPAVYNCTIAGNCASSGGGVYVGSSPFILENSIVAFNTSGLRSTAGPFALLTLRNNDFYNPGGYEYLDCSPGTGDVSADPKFVNWQFGNLHIQPDSPCRDAGWNDAPVVPVADIDGQPGIQPIGGSVDIGADESDGTVWSVAPAIVRVDGANGSDANDGSTWTLAKKTVQAAIDGAAVAGGEVWVKAGIYNELISPKSHVHIYGGFAGTETTKYERDWRANVTILDPNGSKGTIVTFTNVGYQMSTIDGFTIQNGFSLGYGGGIFCNGSSPIISNNVIRSNYSSTCGGGIYCTSSFATIVGNSIVGNSSNNTGGIYSWSSALNLINNFIVANSAGTGAGGAYCGAGDKLVNNTIVANVASDDAGGVSCGSSAGLYNNIIAYNSSGIRSWAGKQPTLRNNLVYNPDSYNYSGCSAGTGDISADPGLANRQCGGFHIQPDSPCRDAGWSEAPGIPSLDIDNQPRVQPVGGSVDIGADESDGTVWNVAPVIVRVDGANGSDTNDGSSWTLAKKTVQAAIDVAAVAGGEVWVKAGIYNEKVKLKAYAYVYGGFAGTETERDERDWATHVTILDGTASGSVVAAKSTGYRLATLDGFTIRNGKAQDGAGVHFSYASATLSHNTIVDNVASRWGGGIYGEYSTSLISDSIVARNTAQVGGGIYSGGPATIIGNTVVANKATSSAGGIYLYISSPSVLNNIIAFNSSGVSKYTSGTPSLICNDVYNPDGANYTGLSAGSTDISVDPSFLNRAGGDYHLSATSPCVNAGQNAALGDPRTDVDGESRISGGSIDIGADEYWQSLTDAKRAIGDTRVSLGTGVVSAAFPDFFYVEDVSRAAGIRVDKAGHELCEGARVSISGLLSTNGDGERTIIADFAQRNATGSVAPLAVNNKAVGGGQMGMQMPVWGWVPFVTGSPRWMPSYGLNNIGLLIKTWGRITYADDTYFYIDDGSGINDNSGHKGIKVYGSVPLNPATDPVGMTVIVTGISSCEKNGADPVRVIRTRRMGDVVLAM